MDEDKDQQVMGIAAVSLAITNLGKYIVRR